MSGAGCEEQIKLSNVATQINLKQLKPIEAIATVANREQPM